jgi:hypothetical protein
MFTRVCKKKEHMFIRVKNVHMLTGTPDDPRVGALK